MHSKKCAWVTKKTKQMGLPGLPLFAALADLCYVPCVVLSLEREAASPVSVLRSFGTLLELIDF